MTLTVLGIDPGLSKLGWIILTVKDKRLLAKGTITARKITSKVKYRDLCNEYNQRIITLAEVEEQITNLMTEYKPDYIAIEGAFFNSRFATAFAALIQVTMIIERLLYTIYKKPLYSIPTKLAKKCISGYGGNKKQPIQEVIQQASIIKINKKLKDINEHEADAIAVAYTFIELIYPTVKVLK